MKWDFRLDISPDSFLVQTQFPLHTAQPVDVGLFFLVVVPHEPEDYLAVRKVVNNNLLDFAQVLLGARHGSGRFLGVLALSGTLNLTTRKTRARIAISLSPDLRAVLKANPAPKGARPEAVPLFPKAWRIVKESGKVSTPSLQFTNILAAVNLREAVTHTSAKKGRDTAREVATVSFHSLRHSAVSLLKAAGVPDATVMALVGHEALAMWAHYTHVGKESLESAVASLPSFGLAPEGATPASNDEDAGVNENSATLKPA